MSVETEMQSLRNSLDPVTGDSIERGGNSGSVQDVQGRAGLKKMSQNSGHAKNRSTIERRCVERHITPSFS